MSKRRYKRLRSVVLALIAVMAMNLNGALGVFVSDAHAAPTAAGQAAALAFVCSYADPASGTPENPGDDHHAACCDVCPLHAAPVALPADLQVVPVVWRQAATRLLPVDACAPACSPLHRNYASRAPPLSA